MATKGWWNIAATGSVRSKYSSTLIQILYTLKDSVLENCRTCYLQTMFSIYSYIISTGIGGGVSHNVTKIYNAMLYTVE